MPWGGIDAIFAAFALRSAPVDAAAVRALGSLLLDWKACPDFPVERGIQAVIATMLAHPGDADVQQSGLFALITLADLPASEDAIVALGAIPVVAKALAQPRWKNPG